MNPSRILLEESLNIPSALRYGNEVEVGRGIKSSGIPRDQVFLTTKLWNTYHNRVEEGLRESLANLETDYLDLYLIHWLVDRPCMKIRTDWYPRPVSLPPGASNTVHDTTLPDWDFVKTW